VFLRTAGRVYLFGAVCPERGTGAAVVLPHVNIDAMNIHLAEISRSVTHGAHAVVVLDQAGWHTSPKLRVPENISLRPLPPYAPELNPVEQVWAYLRANFLSHRVWNSYGAIVDACCDAWNKLKSMPQRLASITRRIWARAVSGKGVWYNTLYLRIGYLGVYVGLHINCNRIEGLAWPRLNARPTALQKLPGNPSDAGAQPSSGGFTLANPLRSMRS